MVNFLPSVTSRLSFMASELKQAISGLYAWLKQGISRLFERARTYSSPARPSASSLDSPLTGLAVTINKNGEWWELESRGPMRDVTVVCTDYDMGAEELRRQIDDQCHQYDLSCQEEGYWRERETPRT